MFSTKHFIVMPIVDGQSEFAFVDKEAGQAYVEKIRATNKPESYSRVYVWNPDNETLYAAGNESLFHTGNVARFRKASEHEQTYFEDEINDHYANAQREQHTCIMQETPDGYGCVTCLYT